MLDGASNLPPSIDISDIGLRLFSTASGEIGLELPLAAIGLRSTPELPFDSRLPKAD
jgi:hypothetical protein